MNKATRIALMLGVAIGITSAVIVPSNAFQEQRPPSPFADPKNLKVLPEDISIADLRSTMRGFSFALGVRCTHCHVGDDSESVLNLEFSKDDKETKRIAREMLKMVADINERVTGLERAADHDFVTVECTTCHRGQDRPRLIQSILAAALEDGGADAAVAKYMELREANYGSHTYDFSAFTLAEFASTVVAGGDAEGGVKLLDMANELNPDNTRVLFTMARAHEQIGNGDEAMAAWRKLVELNPENPFFAQQLAKLKGEGAEE